MIAPNSATRCLVSSVTSPPQPAPPDTPSPPRIAHADHPIPRHKQPPASAVPIRPAENPRHVPQMRRIHLINPPRRRNINMLPGSTTGRRAPSPAESVVAPAASAPSSNPTPTANARTYTPRATLHPKNRRLRRPPDASTSASARPDRSHTSPPMPNPSNTMLLLHPPAAPPPSQTAWPSPPRSTSSNDPDSHTSCHA